MGFFCVILGMHVKAFGNSAGKEAVSSLMRLQQKNYMCIFLTKVSQVPLDHTWSVTKQFTGDVC